MFMKKGATVWAISKFLFHEEKGMFSEGDAPGARGDAPEARFVLLCCRHLLMSTFVL